jgi:hypothetical protein
MKVYVFASSTLTNIWAGVGARRWAVSQPNPAARGKARNLPVGGFGLLYCVQTSSFTVPFVIGSRPNMDEIVYHVWPEAEGWHLPFKIIPLGTPEKKISTNELQSLPDLIASGKRWNDYLLVSPTTVFAGSEVSEADWEILPRGWPTF